MSKVSLFQRILPPNAFKEEELLKRPVENPSAATCVFLVRPYCETDRVSLSAPRFLSLSLSLLPSLSLSFKLSMLNALVKIFWNYTQLLINDQ